MNSINRAFMGRLIIKKQRIMEENIKEKSIKLAIEAMRPLPVNSFAGYCSVTDDRSPEEKHRDNMRFCKEINELQSDMLITLASKIETFLNG